MAALEERAVSQNRGQIYFSEVCSYSSNVNHVTDPPKEDADYAGKKAYALDSKQADGEKLGKQKVLLLPGFRFCVLFHIYQVLYCYKNIAKIIFSG